MNGRLLVLDKRGHGIVSTWSDSRASRMAAEREFNALRRKHYTLFRGLQSDDGEVLTRFDPEAEVIIATPRMSAG